MSTTTTIRHVMTRDDIVAVMEKITDLNDFGIGTFDGHRDRPAKERAEFLRRDREQLLASEEACTRLCEWLANLEKIRTINDRHSSYGLKHMANRFMGYVANGVFIAAAAHCGFPYRIYPGSPNVCFGISEKSLKKLPRCDREAV